MEAETFEQARELVQETLLVDDREGWVTDDQGAQDDVAWLVGFGPREWLVEGDEDAAPLTGTAAFVEKATGFVTEVVVAAELDRVRVMRDA